MSTEARQGKKKLVLHVEVPGIYVDDLPGYVADAMDEGATPTPRDFANVLTNEWIRDKVGLTLVTLPAEQSGNDEFEISAMTGSIVGIEIVDKAAGQ